MATVNLNIVEITKKLSAAHHTLPAATTTGKYYGLTTQLHDAIVGMDISGNIGKTAFAAVSAVSGGIVNGLSYVAETIGAVADNFRGSKDEKKSTDDVKNLAGEGDLDARKSDRPGVKRLLSVDASEKIAPKGWASSFAGAVGSSIGWAASIVSDMPGAIARAVTGTDKIMGEGDIPKDSSKDAKSEGAQSTVRLGVEQATLAEHVAAVTGIKHMQQRVEDHSAAGHTLTDSHAKALATLDDLSPNVALAAVLLRMGLNVTNEVLKYVGIKDVLNTDIEKKDNKFIVYERSLTEIKNKLLQVPATKEFREEIDALLEKNAIFVRKVQEILNARDEDGKVHIGKNEKKRLDAEYVKFVDEYKEIIRRGTKILLDDDHKKKKGPYTTRRERQKKRR